MKIPDIIDIAYKVIKAFEKISWYCLSYRRFSGKFCLWYPRATLDADIVADIKSNRYLR